MKMIFLVMIIACVLGVIVGLNAPMISYTYSSYLAIAIIAALDSVFGGVASVINKKFDMKIFISGFFGNAILAILLTVLGEKLNIDIYLAAIVVFVGRMFNNLGIIRRYYVEKWTENVKNKSEKNKDKNKEKNEKNEEKEI
jgi:small basic protein